MKDCWYLVNNEWQQGVFVGLSAGGAVVCPGTRMQGFPIEVALASLSLGGAQPANPVVSSKATAKGTTNAK